MVRNAITSVAVVVVAFAGVVGATNWLLGVWDGQPYPVSDPVAAASGLDLHARSAYRALGLSHVTVTADGPGLGLQAEGQSCRRRGMRYWADGLRDSSPPSAPHVIVLTATYRVAPVGEAEAEAALEAARTTLTGKGWKVLATYGRQHIMRETLQPPNSDDTVDLATYPHARLEITAKAPCGRYPEGTPVDESGEPVLPDLKDLMRQHNN
ncbi:hypothetical protein [Streptomyces noursei]|uniref:Uncharacterized protein n=1 Tax=Streptomyces noursei TaxID=1971 RepID=A0A2N8PR69_STRNR|nr:hypothetical protein [Streptomyces noursei]PNE43522.1 hypothetical protein AOB60_01075 [Streptomyces noursei]